jgi:hypothetical protein
MNPSQGMEQSENIQQPQNHCDDYNPIQNGFDGPLHWDESVHQPQEDTYDNQNFENLEQRHDL